MCLLNSKRKIKVNCEPSILVFWFCAELVGEELFDKICPKRVYRT